MLQPAAKYNDRLVRFKVKKCAKRQLLSAAGCYTRPDHSAEALREQEDPKGSKDTLKPDYKVDILPMFKKTTTQCHHKKQERGCKEIQV